MSNRSSGVRLPEAPSLAMRLAGALLAGCLGLPCPAAEPARAAAPTREEVRAALEALRADPGMPGFHKEKTLRFKDWDARDDEKKKDPSGGLPDWLIGFARWISEAGRAFVWVLGALLVALAAVGLRHWIRVRADGGRSAPGVRLPSHVRDLDIRPESLPERIGAAALDLWQRGEHRAALSLLYRGALSRLVHGDRLPILAASTEGECVALAAQRLPPERSAYFGRLVQAWQLAVYGGRLPEPDRVQALCADFDTHLAAAAIAPAQGAAR
jgi:hypothetical protein